LIAPPAEFKTAGPPAAPLKKLKLGSVFGTDGSDSPAMTFSITVCVGAAVRAGLPVVKVPIVIPPEEVKDAVAGVVFPLRLTRTPWTSKLLTKGVAVEVAADQVNALGCPTPRVIVPPEKLIESILTVVPMLPVTRSLAPFARRIPVAVLG
jgi:hypothetical protein